MKKQKYLIKFLGIILVSGIVFTGGFFWGKVSVPFASPTPETQINEGAIKANFDIFWNVWRLIKEKYRDTDSLNSQDMVYGAVGGLVDSLKDPYSEFLPPAVSKRFMEDIKGSFEGIGAELGIKNNALIVIAPLEGTPAKKAGLRSGDEIVKIDDKSTVDMTLEEAVNLIRGAKNTKVKLTILRGDDAAQQEISITRSVIKLPVVSLSFQENNTIAYIQLFNFTENSADDFSKTAQEILNSSAKKIILDLRGNPGGYLESAVDIAGWFLNYGDKVVIEDKGKGQEKIYFAKGRAVFNKWPLVVLVNEGSASASEILAGALRDDLGIKIIGMTSFGKGSVQEMIDLSDGSSLKLTIANWLTPKGLSISKSGIKPDIEVTLSKEDIDENKDPQLIKAIEFLKNLN